MRYLNSQPFSSRPVTKEYADNWDRIFGKSESTHTENFARAARQIFEEDRGLFERLAKGPPVNVQGCVREFHTVFDQPIIDKPAVPSEERVRLRMKLIAEEFLELLEATFDWEGNPRYLKMREVLEDCIDSPYPYARLPVKVDLVETADALADLAYVIEGCNLEYGIDSAEVLEEVHRSNLSKLGKDGKPVYRADGKAVKGPNYSPPDIAAALRRQE